MTSDEWEAEMARLEFLKSSLQQILKHLDVINNFFWENLPILKAMKIA